MSEILIRHQLTGYEARVRAGGRPLFGDEALARRLQEALGPDFIVPAGHIESGDAASPSRLLWRVSGNETTTPLAKLPPIEQIRIRGRVDKSFENLKSAQRKPVGSFEGVGRPPDDFIYAFGSKILITGWGLTQISPEPTMKDLGWTIEQSRDKEPQPPKPDKPEDPPTGPDGPEGVNDKEKNASDPRDTEKNGAKIPPVRQGKSWWWLWLLFGLLILLLLLYLLLWPKDKVPAPSTDPPSGESSGPQDPRKRNGAKPDDMAGQAKSSESRIKVEGWSPTGGKPNLEAPRGGAGLGGQDGLLPPGSTDPGTGEYVRIYEKDSEQYRLAHQNSPLFQGKEVTKQGDRYEWISHEAFRTYDTPKSQSESFGESNRANQTAGGSQRDFSGSKAHSQSGDTKTEQTQHFRGKRTEHAQGESTVQRANAGGSEFGKSSGSADQMSSETHNGSSKPGNIIMAEGAGGLKIMRLDPPDSAAKWQVRINPASAVDVKENPSKYIRFIRPVDGMEASGTEVTLLVVPDAEFEAEVTTTDSKGFRAVYPVKVGAPRR